MSIRKYLSTIFCYTDGNFHSSPESSLEQMVLDNMNHLVCHKPVEAQRQVRHWLLFKGGDSKHVYIHLKLIQ